MDDDAWFGSSTLFSALSVRSSSSSSASTSSRTLAGTQAGETKSSGCNGNGLKSGQAEKIIMPYVDGVSSELADVAALLRVVGKVENFAVLWVSLFKVAGALQR